MAGCPGGGRVPRVTILRLGIYKSPSLGLLPITPNGPGNEVIPGLWPILQ